MIRSVEPAISESMTLAGTRSGSGIDRTPVRKSWISAAISSPPSTHGSQAGAVLVKPNGAGKGGEAPDQALAASPCARSASSDALGVIAWGSSFRCKSEGLPLSRARTKAGAKSSVCSTVSPCAP